MFDENKRNLQYFEASSMRELFDSMQTWQNDHGKRLLSLSLAEDGGKFCCIALTNPTEVIIKDGSPNGAQVTASGALKVLIR
jgi:hypothetical protein